MLLSVFAAMTSCKKDDEPKPAPTKVTADAGSDQTVSVGQTIALDGSKSKDESGKSLSYKWEFTKKPNGSNATLSSTTVEKPTLAPDVAGEYELELTVTNDNGTAKDKVLITATSSPVSNILKEDIEADLVLTNIVADPTKPDYFVTEDIRVYAKLTINPGVVLEFESGNGLYIQEEGSIVAKGTATEKIVFTGKNKTQGFWKGVLISSANAENEFNYVEMIYGGNINLSGMGSAIKTNLALYGYTGAMLKVSNSSFAQSGGYGMYVQDGAQLQGFTKNTFNNNAGTALYVPVNQVHTLDAASTFTGGNAKNGVEIEGTLEETDEVTWPAFADGSAYFVMNDIRLDAGVNISAGAKFVFMADKALYVEDEGHIIAVGTADKKITFTGNNALAGYWKGILISSPNPLNEMAYVQISHAGSSNLSGMGSAVKGNLVLYGYTKGAIKVSNSTFSHSGGYGMYVQDGAEIKSFANNTFANNTGAALYSPANQVHMLDAASKFTGTNGYNGVQTEGTVKIANEVTWQSFTDGSRYNVVGDVSFDSGIKISAGARFDFEAGKALYIDDEGHIIAKGTTNNKIVFTGKVQQKGFWKGILIRSASALNEMDFVQVSYGGSSNLSGMSSNVKANIALYSYSNGKLKLTNSTVTNSGGWGVYAEGAEITDISNTYTENISGPVKK